VNLNTPGENIPAQGLTAAQFDFKHETVNIIGDMKPNKGVIR